MKKFTEKFENIKKSKDPEEINDFLIELGNNPAAEYLSILDFFIEDFNPEIFNQIKLNLIFNIGEIGKSQGLDNKYLDFLIKEYYSSDRWIRNEIICTLSKIASQIKLPEKFLEILKYAIIDDYLPIAINAMKTLIYYDDIPNELFKNLFKVLQTSDSDLNDQISKLLLKFIHNENRLFELLNASENYKILNKKAIRALLIIFFSSAISMENLDLFKDLLTKSEWESKYKKAFFNEIEVYEKLLLRNI